MISFLIWDNEQDRAITDEDEDIEFTYDTDKKKLIIWRTKNKNMMLGDCEADVECYDFLDDFEIIKISER